MCSPQPSCTMPDSFRRFYPLLRVWKSDPKNIFYHPWHLKWLHRVTYDKARRNRTQLYEDKAVPSKNDQSDTISALTKLVKPRSSENTLTSYLLNRSRKATHRRASEYAHDWWARGSRARRSEYLLSSCTHRPFACGALELGRVGNFRAGRAGNLQAVRSLLLVVLIRSKSHCHSLILYPPSHPVRFTVFQF